MAKAKTDEKVAILGASSGLGRALAHRLAKSDFAGELFLASRKIDRLESLKKEIFKNVRTVTTFSADFSNPQDQKELTQRLLMWQPDRVVYCAGGGPHGLFAKKEWKDHQWALEVCFLYPSRLLHALMQQKVARQMAFVGSHIAERADNNLSPSYGAAKTALRNLIRSVNIDAPEIDLRLFCPGYMDTAMLPPNAPPRKQFEMIAPTDAAERLWQWLETPSKDWHLELPNNLLEPLAGHPD